MADPNLKEIPLPLDNATTVTHKKTAKEMLQEALKDHKLPNCDVKTLAPGKLVTPLLSDMNVLGQSTEASSQSIVDELFKDFISQKFGGKIKDSHASNKICTKSSSVDDKISQILDMEINSIKSKTYNLDESESKERHKYSPVDVQKSSVNLKPNDNDSLKLAPHSNGQQKTIEQPLLNESSSKHNISSSIPNSVSHSSDHDKTTSALSVPSRLSASANANHPSENPSPDSDAPMCDKKGAEAAQQHYSGMLPLSVAKKLGAPKLLKMKLSTESLSLIKSNDRMDRDGRVWEEGEVCSSHSDKSDKEDADDESDEHPSETGSIASNGAESHSSKHKRKHKHKHKKKKKKSSKEKRRSKSRDDPDGYRDRSSSKSRKDRTHSRDGSSEREESNKRDKEKSKKRKKSHSRSRTPKRRKSRSRSRSSSKKKDSTDSGRHHFNEWDARHYSDVPRHRSRSKEPATEKHKRRSRERSRSEERDARLQIDKDKLRRIAIANALQNMKSGQGPRVDLTVVKSGGKSVEELTEFCKKISAKNKERDEYESDESLDMAETKMSDDEDRLIHHPFKVKEPASSSIIMNIRNAKQLPVLTPTEKQAQQAALRLTFPVSSGSHHRANESEWVPVEKSVPPPVASTQPSQTAKVEVPAPVPKKTESIFPDVAEVQKLDISSIISERLQAVRKLQENPYDVQALTKMHKVQEQASKWATSKHLPGQFLGSTGAQVLSQQELMGDKKHQAWARKNQLMHAAPVNGGIGMFLLQKMGWKQGEGLGKNNEGSKEPLLLDVKIDRKGLTASIENPKHKGPMSHAARAKDLSNKHPVSALMELCNKRRWGPPIFTVAEENGPDHKKTFLFKVKVNNVEYQPAAASLNKKTAKAQCAAICLQEMGLLPRDAPMNY